VLPRVDSHHNGGKEKATPHLRVAYRPRVFRAFRETGASWEALPEGTPQPKGVHPPARLLAPGR
jgi:hypothetical protein